MLLTQMCKVNAQDVDGEAALHAAGYCGHLEVVRLLLDHKADVHVQDAAHNTPLDMARKWG